MKSLMPWTSVVFLSLNIKKKKIEFSQIAPKGLRVETWTRDSAAHCCDMCHFLTSFPPPENQIQDFFFLFACFVGQTFFYTALQSCVAVTEFSCLS